MYPASPMAFLPEIGKEIMTTQGAPAGHKCKPVVKHLNCDHVTIRMDDMVVNTGGK